MTSKSEFPLGWNALLSNLSLDVLLRNLLTNATSIAPSNIRYYIAFYRGYFLQQSSYMIQVSFAGFNVSGAWD